MKIITGGRGSGKTTELIKLCAENGGYIVCMHRNAAHGIAPMARKMKLKIPLPLTFDVFLNKQYYGAGVKRFYIDDADVLLQHLSTVRVEAISVSGESEERHAIIE